MKHDTTNRFFLYCLIIPIVALLLPMQAASMAGAGDVSVTAELNSTKFPVDQAVLFTLTINGSRAGKPEMPKADGLQFVYQGQSSQMQWINGKSSSSIAYSFMVQAEQPGNYTIASVKVTVDGKVYTTQPVSCTVLPSTATNAPPAGRQAVQPPGSSGPSARLRSGEADKIGFMRIDPAQDTIYSGQLVPFTIKAYFRQGMRVTLKSSPRFIGENFILHSIDDKPQQTETMVNGTAYTLLTWQGMLSAVKEGTAALEVEMDASLLVRSNRGRSGGQFGSLFSNDPFFDDFFSSYSRREVKVASPEKSITVKDLPTAGRPEGFNGAIGTFSLAVAAQPVKGKIGDPITLKMAVSGTGNFDLVQSPTLTATKGWKTYPATENFAEHSPGNGTKTFEQAVVPTLPDLKDIPAVQFSYFDPYAKEYVTIKSDPITIQLESSAGVTAAVPQSAPAEQLPSPADAPPKSDNLAPLHTDPGTLVTTIKPLYQKSWFISLMAFSLLCLIAALLLFLRRKKLADNPEIILQKQVSDQLNRHLQQMNEATSAARPDIFVTHCRTAIQEHYGLQWSKEPLAITLSDLQQRLSADSPLLALFTRLEQAGYSGAPPDRQEMENMLNILTKELKSS